MMPAKGGWHIREWTAEFLGTAILLTGGLSAVFLDFGPGSPVKQVIPSASLRLLLTGALFAATGSLVAISPLGRLSGGHINPAVTFAFWMTGHVHPHDLIGYVIAQCLGALLGTTAVVLLWSRTARSLADGATLPGQGIPAWGAIAIEAVMTGLLLLVIFAFVSNLRTMHWTPLAVWVVVTLLVRFGAPLTGTSLNPARSLGPALFGGSLLSYPIYVIGPLAGSLLAVGIYRLIANPRRLLTAKLFHDARYPCVFRHAVAIS